MKRNLIPWIVILLIVIGLPIVNAQGKRRLLEATRATAPATQSSGTIDFQTVMAGKSIIAAAVAAPQEKEKLTAQLEMLNKSPMQRVAAATLAGELEGPEAARTRLAAITDDEDAAAFLATYETGTPLPQAIATRYDFFAQLAQSNGKPPADPQRAAVTAAAQRTLLVLTIAGFVLVVAFIVGTGLFITAIVLLAMGRLKPAAPAAEPRESSVYVQAFAIYLSGVVLLSLTVEGVLYMVPSFPRSVRYLSLVVAVIAGCAWPAIRGVPWATLRRDWGLHRGRGFFTEPFAGVAGYLAGLPIIACGVMLSLLISRLTGATMSHPIEKELFAHPIAMFLLAAVFAPLTEETLFRGALLSHLRGAWNPWIAALISAVIFAAVHPQGWAALPALGSIGFVLGVIRQWRGSLLASIAAHALNNGAIVLMLLLAAS